MSLPIPAGLATERTRIARDLHDGCLQTLGAMDLQLETLRALLRRGDTRAAVTRLTDLQRQLRCEHDRLRAYVRKLAGVGDTVPNAAQHETQVSVRANFTASGSVVAEVLAILGEGVTNIQRHALAQSARLGVQDIDGRLLITIHDAGRGLPAGTQRPWTISSRVAALHGQIREPRNDRVGTHFEITLPHERVG